MAATKTKTGFTWGGGGSTGASGTSSSISTAGDYADTVMGTITVPASVTASASVQVQESLDGTTWYSPPTKVFSPGTTQGTYSFEIPVDPTAAAVQLVFTASTGAASTIAAQLGQLQG